MRLLSLPMVLLAVSCCHAADTVAVLPLFNLDEAKSPSLDWVGESVAETIHEALSAAGMLVLDRDDRTEVYSRLSVRAGAVLTKATVIKIGETLDAGKVVFGEFHVDGAENGASTVRSNARLTIRIIDLKGFQESSDLTQTGPLETLSQMESKLAWQLMHQLAPSDTPSEEEFSRDRPPVRVDAMEGYVRGLMTANQDQKIKLFSQAVRLDDHFSQPKFQLGRIYFAKKDYKTAAQWLEKVSRVDSHHLEASFLLGICRYYQGDFDGATDLFKMVSDEVPLNEVFNDLGAAESRKNDNDDAAENFGKAVDGDQADPDYWFNLGYSLWKQGKFALAAEKFRAVLDRAPTDPEATAMLGRCIKMDGPRAGDPRSEGKERIKTTFEDSAFRQLQAELKKK